ncbi:MAG: shikimate dehydrogenase [Elusimicrobia bacterium]|nr:shikimate dehydrogenase [Elusimicrobiota bacterium]
MKLGLFGGRIAHSRSPKIFLRLSHRLGRKIDYRAVAVRPGQLAEAVAQAREAGWRGANVTVPLKEEAYALCEKLTPAARAVGAVNVLRFDEDLVGHNTDGEGLRDALKRAGIRARGKRALVFGAGGAARAAGWALGKNGARSVRFSARTAARAQKAAKDLGRLFPRTKFTAGACAPAEIWINATPLGMKGYPDSSPAPKRMTPPAAAMDLVYGRRTAFQRSTAASDGSAMLAFQALRAFEFWDKSLGASRRADLAEDLIEVIA